jgi:hypothetical protein
MNLWIQLLEPIAARRSRVFSARSSLLQIAVGPVAGVGLIESRNGTSPALCFEVGICEVLLADQQKRMIPTQNTGHFHVALLEEDYGLVNVPSVQMSTGKAVA